MKSIKTLLWLNNRQLLHLWYQTAMVLHLKLPDRLSFWWNNQQFLLKQNSHEVIWGKLNLAWDARSFFKNSNNQNPNVHCPFNDKATFTFRLFSVFFWIFFFFGDGNWRQAEAWIVLLAGAVEMNALALERYGNSISTVCRLAHLNILHCIVW